MWWQQRLPGKGLAWAMETLSMFFPQEPFQSGSAVKIFGFPACSWRDALLALGCLGLPCFGLLPLPATSVLCFLPLLGFYCVCIYPFSALLRFSKRVELR